MAQTQVDAGELGRKQSPGQQPGPQTAVMLEQADAAHTAPDQQQPTGADAAQAGLKQGRHLMHDGFDKDLLQSPEHAARQQDADGQAVEVVFALGRIHADIVHRPVTLACRLGAGPLG